MNKYLKYSLLGVMTVALLTVLAPFITEILLAAIFAFALDPLTKRLANSQRIPKFFFRFKSRQWVAITLVVLTLAVTLPIGFTIYNIYDAIYEAASDGFQNTDFYKDVLHLKVVLIEYGDRILTTLNLRRKFDLVAISNNFTNDLGRKVLAISGDALSSLPALLMAIFVFSCALYFFLAENRRIKAMIVQSGVMGEGELDHLTMIFQKSSRATIVAAIITGFIQALIVALGAVILRSGDFVIVFVITFFFSFIPVIGAGPVALFLSLLSLIKMDYGAAIALAVVAVVAGTIDNLVKPYLVGSEEDIHPVVILLAIIGAIIIFGLPGLFLGPVIVSVTFQLYKHYVLAPYA